MIIALNRTISRHLSGRDEHIFDSIYSQLKRERLIFFLVFQRFCSGRALGSRGDFNYKNEVSNHYLRRNFSLPSSCREIA